MTRGEPRIPGADAAVYVISVAAELSGCTRRPCARTSGWA